MVLYRDEFEVGRKSVSVGAGATVSSSIASTKVSITPAWRIREFSGRPTGFRNTDLQEHKHPSDTRMASWGPLTYTVESSSLCTFRSPADRSSTFYSLRTAGFPMAQIKAVNNPTTIKFTLTSSQTGAATLRIGTTLSFAGARPQVTVNGWSGPAPGAPVDLNSRGFTRGAYRGINTVSIPSDTLVSGTNTITINVISGSGGDGFPSLSFIYDAVELVTTGTSTSPTTTTITTAAQPTTISGVERFHFTDHADTQVQRPAPKEPVPTVTTGTQSQCL
ncbi:hypothetical protein FRC12_018089 [Ceratobasidium sp. 428]|nr:hypothetical protein FRC12_018089 [Ceratobasidium sp. 428]